MKSKMNGRALWGLALASILVAATSLAQTFQKIEPFQKIHQFTASEGCDPQAGIMQLANGTLVGTTVGCPDISGIYPNGTMFTMDTQGRRFRNIHEFDWSFDGANPHAPLCLAPDGDLYGTTLHGLYGWGGIYKTPAPGELTVKLTVLKAFFDGPEGGLPHAPLIWGDPDANSSEGKLYGVTTEGGTVNNNCPKGCGTIFVMDENNVVTTLHPFKGSDGAHPFEALTIYRGQLWGTTTKGGTNNQGTIYRVDFTGSNFTVVHNFTGIQGADPEGPLVVIDGALYGTTYSGGSHNLGTVFELYPRNGSSSFVVIHNFTGAGDGSNPHGGLMQARDGNIYGTTMNGGRGPYVNSNFGTIFKIQPTTNSFSVVHTFNGEVDGGHSQSRLIQGSDGALYGTTGLVKPSEVPSSGNLGVVFRLRLVGY